MNIEQRKILDAYISMVDERINAGFEGSLLTFMFKDLKGSEDARKAQMTEEVGRIFSVLLSRFFKRPATMPINQMSFFMGCVDWPVHKKTKKAINGITNNDGMHFGGIYLVPPKSRTAMNLEDVVDRAMPKIMRTGKLTHIHVKPMRDTPRKAAGYVLKSVERLRIGSGEILILPRVHSEMNRRVGVLGTTSGAETMFR
ncbi:hypothetical protein [Rhizobium leguminosarum]|uniref:hypothetical protein n=1 Tax=Rhizobium leguminosarum TaxID=384 RepID=UPI003F98AF9B